MIWGGVWIYDLGFTIFDCEGGRFTNYEVVIGGRDKIIGRQNHVKWGLVEVMALLVRLYRFFTDLTAHRGALDPRIGVIGRYQVICGDRKR